MLDAQLVSAAISSREAYERVAPHITEKDMTPAAGFWWRNIAEWYKRDPYANSVDRTVLWESGKLRIANPKHEDTLHGFLRELPNAVSPANVATTVLELQRFNVGMELASAIGGRDEAKAKELVVRFAELLQATDLRAKARPDMFDAPSVDDLFDEVGDEQRIALSPRRLNDRTNGGALKGDHILIFGRPDSGKSRFAMNMAAGFVSRGLRGIYFGNEDRIAKLKRRMMSRLLGRPWKDIEANKRAATDRYKELGYEDALRMTQLTMTNTAMMRQKIEEVGPDFIVLDQIRNMQGGDSMSQRLETAGQEFRELLLKYDLVGVSVTQANDRTQKYGQEPPIWLGMSDVDSSRTGLPGTADLMVGLGVNQELLTRHQVAVSIPKSKLSDEDNAKEGFIADVDVKRGIIT